MTEAANRVAGLLPESDREELLRSAYISGAHTASDVQASFKLSVILLKRIRLNSPADVALLIESLYSFSKPSRIRNNIPRDPSLEDDALRYIDEAVTPLLVADNPAHKYVTSMDFLKLAHMYLCFGWLQKCLETVRFASVVGFSEVGLSIQEWSVLRALDDESAADEYMRRLHPILATACTLVNTNRLEQPDLIPFGAVCSSGFYVAYMYLHCALYLQRQGDTAFELVVGEAYRVVTGTNSFLSQETLQRESDLLCRQQQKKERKSIVKRLSVTPKAVLPFTKEDEDELRAISSQLEQEKERLMEWFEDPSLWLRMGDELQGSPFVVLSEVSYWACYVRQEEPSASVLESMINSMERRKAHPLITYRFLLEAYAMSEWCGYTRLKIIQIEGAIPAKHSKKNAPDIIRENILFINLQRFIRKILYQKIAGARKIEIFKEQKARKVAFLLARDKALMRSTDVRNKYFLDLLWRWYNAIHALKYLKYNSSVVIQHSIRDYIWRVKHTARKERVLCSDFLYFSAAEIHNNFTRLTYYQIWRQTTSKKIYTRLIGIVCQFLKSVKHLKKHEIFKARVLKIIKNRKLMLRTTYLRKWVMRRERYRRAVAVFVIRRWVRARLLFRKGEESSKNYHANHFSPFNFIVYKRSYL